MTTVYRANVARPLNASERAEYATLRQQSRDVLATGDAVAYRAFQRRRNDLHARCWFYSPAAAARHTVTLLALIEDPWAVAQRTNLAGNAWRDGIWDRVRRIGAPTLVMYGYQDYEPIT
jgi:pimeloyl-ACP methyl ester carboxylesterase